MVTFTFKGRYTLREMNGTYYLYDREKGGLINSPNFTPKGTFTQARTELIKFKLSHDDEV